MKRFFVGQRVIKARGEQCVGITATVIGFECPGYDGCDIELRMDEDWANSYGVLKSAHDTAYSYSSLYEPLYDGNEIVSWESMRKLWMPEGVPA